MCIGCASLFKLVIFHSSTELRRGWISGTFGNPLAFEEVDDGLGIVVAGLVAADRIGDRQLPFDGGRHDRRVDERRVGAEVLARLEGRGLPGPAGVRRGADQRLGREHEEAVGVADVLRDPRSACRAPRRVLGAVVRIQHSGIGDLGWPWDPAGTPGPGRPAWAWSPRSRTATPAGCRASCRHRRRACRPGCTGCRPARRWRTSGDCPSRSRSTAASCRRCR